MKAHTTDLSKPCLITRNADFFLNIPEVLVSGYNLYIQEQNRGTIDWERLVLALAIQARRGF